MIDLHNITQQNPTIILRGEFCIISDDSLAIVPNAKNGKIFILLDIAKKISAVAHFDSSKNLEENIANIFSEMVALGSEIKDLKCNVMEKEGEKTLKEKLQRSFKDKVADLLKQNGNHDEINYTSWSGNDFCNIVLKGNGDLIIDNSPELMRSALNLLIFTAEGDERMNNAINPDLIINLRKIRVSVAQNKDSKVVKVLNQTSLKFFDIIIKNLKTLKDKIYTSRKE